MNLLFFIISYGAIQSLLLVYILASSKRKNSKGLSYLIFLLIITTYVGVQHMLAKLGHCEAYSFVCILGFSPMFLIPPLYYLFSTRNLKNGKFSAKTFLHFVPFIIFFFLRFIEVSIPIKKSIFLVFVLQLLSYSIISFRLLNSKKNHVKPAKILKILTICMLIFAISVSILYITTIIFEIKSIGLISIITIFLIGFVTVLEVHMIKSLSSSFNFATFQLKKYKNSNLQSQNIESLNEKLNEMMTQEEVFLDSNLNANDLAERLKLSRHQLTEFINQELGSSFNKLLNKHRIEYVKRDLLDKNKSHLSISGLANEAGFKSTATFYRVFKSQTGFTPSEYIKKHS